MMLPGRSASKRRVATSTLQHQAPAQVHAHELVELLGGRVLDALVEGADAGVVHEHVDEPEATGLIHEGADSFGVGDIAGNGNGVRPESLRGFVEGLLAAGADDDTAAAADNRLSAFILGVVRTPAFRMKGRMAGEIIP